MEHHNNPQMRHSQVIQNLNPFFKNYISLLNYFIIIHKKWVIDAYTTKITTTGNSLSEALFLECMGSTRKQISKQKLGTYIN